MKLRLFGVLVFCGLLIGCANVGTIEVESNTTPVTDAYANPNKIDSIVAPYSESLAVEMNIVIAEAKQDFIKGRPNASLNNWATDALLVNQREFGQGKQIMCLLNVGGLRNPLNEGDITIGDIFKLMPFDNQVVWVELPTSVLPEMEAYLLVRGGEPIAGAKFVDDKLVFLDPIKNTPTFWVVTSDYLMNGGDDMDFFEKKLGAVYPEVLLRDAFIEEAKKQKTLVYNNEERYLLE
ncbi:MAG: 5'-nucleotidase C-terminal domain-containing protein [Crocinitomicaceae bacterium]|nr:5'-nucleotidase C-terminal domain-containing protein [Crocinitomicaceae bacterium]